MLQYEPCAAGKENVLKIIKKLKIIGNGLRYSVCTEKKKGVRVLII